MKEDFSMENQTPDNVPYIIHEGAMARAERANRRLLIALIVSLCIMLLNNVAWIVHEEHQAQQITEMSTENERP